MAFESIKNKMFGNCATCRVDDFIYEGFVNNEHVYKCKKCGIRLNQWGMYIENKPLRAKPFSKIKREYAELMHTGKIDCECDDCVNSKVDQLIEERLDK